MIEELSLRAWPATHTETYDGWLLRFADGYTKRANSVTPLDHGEVDVDVKVGRCEAEYRSLGLTPMFRIPSFVPDAVNLRLGLQNKGYRPLDPTSVQSAPVPDPDPDPWVETMDDVAAWVDLHDTLEGTRSNPEVHLAILEAIEGTTAYLRIDDVACGLAIVERGHVGIYDVAVAEEERRRGFGRRIVETALAFGAEHGAHTAYLSVMQSNAPALALYASFGFEELYTYEYQVFS